MYKRILIPVDGSQLTDRAVAEGLGLAKALGATVVGFAVESQAPLPTSEVALVNYPDEVKAHEARTAAHANTVLGEFERRAAEAGVPFEHHYERDDDVAVAIAQAAHSCRCDLIIMTTHGRSTFGEILFGSTTKNVMSRTKTPLLVLH